MRGGCLVKNYMTLLLAAAFAVGSTFSSQAGSSFKKDIPLTLHMDINTGRHLFMTDILLM